MMLGRRKMVAAGASLGKGGLLCLRWRPSLRWAFWLCWLMSLVGVSLCGIICEIPWGSLQDGILGEIWVVLYS